MVTAKFIVMPDKTQESPAVSELRKVLDTIDDTSLVDALNSGRLGRGPRGYRPSSMWRAVVARYALGLDTMNDLIRRLQEDLELRLYCGFSTIPHRTVFNRFYKRLARHTELVETMFVDLTERIRLLLPDDYGKIVAVDSTTIEAYANPNRKRVRDPDASWTAKNVSRARKGKEWRFGYKYHLVSCVSHDLPIAGLVTTAKRNDSPLLAPVLDRAKEEHNWFAPSHVIADRGYDSQSNHREVIKRGAIPIIHIRDMKKTKEKVQDRFIEGNYTHEGVPVCIGMKPMDYVRSDTERGYLYRCNAEGCHLKDRKGVVYCQDEYWLNPEEHDNPRLFGPIRRDSKEWKGFYRLRFGVERNFKSMKQSRSMDSLTAMGLDRVALHVNLSALTYQATALVNLQKGEMDDMRWMRRKIA